MKKAIIASVVTAILIIGVAWGIVTRQNNMVQRETVVIDTLLESIYAVDDNPPTTPEEVMAVAMDILTALSGEVDIDDGLMAGILYRQRQLFGEELIELNSFEDQYNRFQEQLAERREYGVYQTAISLEDLTYLSETEARAHVAQVFTEVGRVHWVYLLRYDEQMGWYIHSWKSADQFFRVVE